MEPIIGKNPSPNIVVKVQIEIPKNGNVKYEIDHETGELICDRVLYSSLRYDFNYGFIKNTLSEDGDPLDAVVLCNSELAPTCTIYCKIIGALPTRDEKGQDEKIILVPCDNVDPESIGVSDICDIKEPVLKKIKQFFTHYKELESNKFVIVDDFVNKDRANELYYASIVRFNQQSLHQHPFPTSVDL